MTVNLDPLREAIRGWRDDVFEQASQDVGDYISLLWPVITGELRDSLSFTGAFSSDTVVSGTVSWDAPQALWVEEGTQPHLIVGNPLLVFYWPATGRIMYLPYVNHPGTRAQFIVRDNLTEQLWQAQCDLVASQIGAAA